MPCCTAVSTGTVTISETGKIYFFTYINKQGVSEVQGGKRKDTVLRLCTNIFVETRNYLKIFSGTTKAESYIKVICQKNERAIIERANRWKDLCFKSLKALAI